MPNRPTWTILVPLAVVAGALAGCPPRGNAPLPEVTPAMVASAQVTTPEVTVDQLTRGRALMGARCTQCHGQPAPMSEPAGEWPDIMRRMAKKAKLDDAQRDDVLRYVLAARGR